MVKDIYNHKHYYAVRDHRFQRIVDFQKLVNLAEADVIFNEFIRLSRLVCGAKYNADTDEYEHPYDYDKMAIIEDSRFGERTLTSFESCLALSELHIIIPCRRCGAIEGVSCRLIDHLLGTGCSECSNYRDAKSYSIETFILISELKHYDTGYFYEYNNVSYNLITDKVGIVCKSCNELFHQNASSHCNSGYGCTFCKSKRTGESQRVTFDDAVKRCHMTRGDNCDYIRQSRIIEKNGTTSAGIVYRCPICKQEVEQRLTAHLNGHDCNCNRLVKMSLSKQDSFEETILKAKKVHGDKYTYLRLYRIYEEKSKLNISMIVYYCPDCKQNMHQRTKSHIQGSGCKCELSRSKSHLIGRDWSFIMEPIKLYYIRLNIHDDELNIIKQIYKIGVTKNTIASRYRNELPENVTYDVLYEKIFEPGSMAYILEQMIINKCDDIDSRCTKGCDKLRYNLRKNILLITKTSEMFRRNILDIIISTINDYTT